MARYFVLEKDPDGNKVVLIKHGPASKIGMNLDNDGDRWWRYRVLAMPMQPVLLAGDSAPFQAAVMLGLDRQQG